MTTSDLEKSRRAGRLQILAVFALFAVPLAAAIILYVSGWHPATVNYGRLVTPARPIRPVVLTELDRPGQFPFSKLYGKWLLVYFSGDSCGPVCVDALYKMRAMALFQGENVRRVRRVLVFQAPPTHTQVTALVRQFPGLRILSGRAGQVHQLAVQFRQDDAPVQNGVVNVVDPLGNWMMTYPADADARWMRKDLSRLLSVSQIG
ncbi:MAG: hypothetical protein ACYCRH_02670 [Acidiferrobacteraceae bacterium]